MDVKYITVDSSKFGPNNPPIVDGQIIALTDKDAWFYDMLGVRRRVSGQLSVSQLPTDNASLFPDTIVVVQGGDSDGIYLWNGSEFHPVAQLNTDEKVKSEVATSGKAYLSGTESPEDSTGPLKKTTDVYIDFTTGKVYAKGFEGKAADSYSADNAKSAAHATADGCNQDISETYIKRIAISGTKVTVTYGDDTTKEVDTQDTHAVTSLVVTDSDVNDKNAAAANGNVHLNIFDDATIRNSHLLKGDGSVSVHADPDGTLIIEGTDTWQMNTKDHEGYVTAGQPDKVWATDSEGIPDWRVVSSGGGSDVNPVDAGTYHQLTIDDHGLIVDGTRPTTLAEYEITDAAHYAVLPNDINLEDVTSSGFYLGLPGNVITGKPEGVDGFGLIVISQGVADGADPKISQEMFADKKYKKVSTESAWETEQTYTTMLGCTNTFDGMEGMVPKPVMSDQGKFLQSDGTWKNAIPVWEPFPAT